MSISSNFFRINFDSSSAGQAAAAKAEEEARALAEYLDQQAEEEAEDDRPLSPQAAIAEAFDPGQFDWTNIVTAHVGDSLVQWEKATGQIDGMWKHTFEQYSTQMYSAIQTRFFQPNADTTHFLTANDVSESQQTQIQDQRQNYYRNTSAGIKEVIEYGIQFMGGLMGAQLSPATPSGGGGRRGSGGARGPTAQDIRNRFDIEELTRSVDDLNRMLVFEPNDNAKKIARDYVEVVVRGKGEVKVDFESFVRDKIEGTSRFKSIYRNKPKALNPEQYMAPFYSQARTVAAGDEAADLAIAGAQFGASTSAFQSRLARTDSVTGSAPFVNNLQGRLEELNSVFKG